MKWTKFPVKIAMFFVWINRCMFITVDEILHWYFNKRENHFGTHFSRTWNHFDGGLFNASVYWQSSLWLCQNRILMDIENENHPNVASPERERESSIILWICVWWLPVNPKGTFSALQALMHWHIVVPEKPRFV